MGLEPEPQWWGPSGLYTDLADHLGPAGQSFSFREVEHVFVATCSIFVETCIEVFDMYEDSDFVCSFVCLFVLFCLFVFFLTCTLWCTQWISLLEMFMLSVWTFHCKKCCTYVFCCKSCSVLSRSILNKKWFFLSFQHQI